MSPGGSVPRAPGGSTYQRIVEEIRDDNQLLWVRGVASTMLRARPDSPMTEEPVADLAVERKKRVKKSVPAAEGDDTSRDLTQHLAPIWVHTNSNKPLATIDNLKLLLAQAGVTCHYNIISKRNEIKVPGETFTVDNMEPASLACVYSRMKQVLMPVDGYADYLLKIGDENQYNPVMCWVESKPWDGRSRLQELYDTIESPETEAKELLIRRWLITALSLAGKDGVDSAGCLVLQGAQNMGKTWWARQLLAEDVQAELMRSVSGFDPHDRDSLSQFIRFWIVELGDIGSTFRKADIDALKNFITDTKDILRRPYGKGDQVYARRTAMIASVDQEIYLHDTAGNRRFWTIPCTSINSYHKIDMQQLWAEVLALIKQGEGWKLEPDELGHVTRINQAHVQAEPIYELIREKYDPEMPSIAQSWKTATAVATDIGVKNVTQRETRIITSCLRKMQFKSRVSKGNSQFLL